MHLSTMHPSTLLANQYLQKGLLGACVESFGLTNQVLTLTFRDGNTDDHCLWIETAVSANTTTFDDLSIDATARALLFFNSVNLQEVTAISCTDEGDLDIQFANNIKLKLDGSGDEYGEPWQFNLSFYDYDVSIIASEGGYLVFDSRDKPA
ncbi:hypothetical protein [Hymenobacter sp. B1770]|uniref:hypothetical protein n=1 Tax=Hymenobacter sp. B1770 TaxID=1718788 RepID=UPI003CFAFBFD